MGGGVVPEFQHERMAFERLLHDAALHTGAPPVNEAHLAESGPGGGGHIFLDDRLHVTRQEGVKIERGFDRYFVWRIRGQVTSTKWQVGK